MPINHDFVYCPPQEPLHIVYEDDDLVVIEKPAGLLSVPGRLPEHHDSADLRVLNQYPQAENYPSSGYGHLRYFDVCQTPRCRSGGE